LAVVSGKRGNLSTGFIENTEADARAAAIAWIEAEPFIAWWELLRVWLPRADMPLSWRAEFDVTYKPRGFRTAPMKDGIRYDSRGEPVR
jgi:hypothetical protein